MRTSIIDNPKPSNFPDGVGIGIYEKALVKFIENSDAPITIALQGEWGSGKTSLMLSLKSALVSDEKDKPFYGVWINTWQHALIAKGDLAVIGILKSIALELTKHLPGEEMMRARMRMGINFFRIGAIATANVAGHFIGLKAVGNAIDDAAKSSAEEFSKGTGISEIAQLKKDIEDAIKKIFITHPSKKGFIFFIDDLDRIDPADAVVMLEMLKNIFDLDKCIFVLAIDYGVIVKGLKPKYGEMTSENEREFRSFFDKIIQLPFSMPVGAYQIDDFLVETLKNVGFISETESKDERITKTICNFARLSVGTNPRSLKRLANTLSLITLMLKEQPQVAESEMPDPQLAWRDKVVNFALVCFQICYPAIYGILQKDADFKAWDKNLAKKLNLKKLTELEEDKLKQQEQFDEEWERTLYRLCVKDVYLFNKVFEISELLNAIAKLFTNKDDEEPLKQTIERIITYSSVTSVSSGVTEAELPMKRPITDRSWRLNRQCEILIPKTNAKLGNFGILKKASSRTIYKVEYAIDQVNKHDFCHGAENYRAWIEHDGKSYCFYWGHKSFRIFVGAKSSDFEAEESKVNQAGTFASIKDKLEARLKYWYRHNEASSIIKYKMDAVNGGWAFVTIIVRYETLDEFVRSDCVETFASFLAEYFEITDRFVLINKAAQS
jgi:hypothetical protein